MITFILACTAFLAPDWTPVALRCDPDDLVLSLNVAVAAPPLGGLLRLEDVAGPVADPGGVWPLVRRTVLPIVGSDSVTWGLVLHRLAGAGLPADRVGLAGPAVCSVERKVAR